MVTNTSTTNIAQRASMASVAQLAVVDRYRPVRSLSSLAARLVDVAPRTAAPVRSAAKGGVCPDPVASRIVRNEKSAMCWQHGTTHNSIVFGSFGFDRFTDDINHRLGPPPQRRPSV